MILRSPSSDPGSDWPRLHHVGVDGLLIRFGDALSEPANRAALALRAAIEAANLPWIEECSTALVSTYIRFDPLHADPVALERAVRGLLATRDWFAAPLPGGRRLWRVPTVFGTDLAPQLDEAAALAGLTRDAAVAQIAGAAWRVQTLGFAPGQPYLGELPPVWNIPRQSALTPRVPVGAVTVAIRQIVLFAVAAPTGWRHVGQTALRLFRPDDAVPFVLRPGDEVRFDPVPRSAFEALRQSGPDGGATCEVLP